MAIQTLIIGIIIGAAVSALIVYLIFKNKILSVNQQKEILRLENSSLAEKSQLLSTEMNRIRTESAKEFELLANKILDEKSSKVTTSNKEAIDAIVKPLKEKIQLFEEKIDRNFVAENRDRSALLIEINKLNQLNTQLGEEANQLSGALKGNSKIQGDWGEMILESILEKSGLEKNIDFLVQENFTSEEGKLNRPDVVVNLPENKHLIIDSKVSIKAYTDFINSDSNERADASLKEHVQSLRAHIKGLSEKNYQQLKGINSPEFVLLFIPIEGAFSLALKGDQGLYQYAWDRKVILVSPTTLLATLRTVASIWQQEKRLKNTEAIASEAGKLYDKFVAFTEDLLEISKRIDQAKTSSDSALNKLVHGTGNLISRAEKMKEMGAKTTKQIPDKLLGFIVLVLSILVASCSTSKQTSSTSASIYYNDDLSLFYPDVTLFHHSDDSSTIYFDIATKELLYSRPKGVGPFEANVEVTWLVKDIVSGMILDSNRVSFRDILNNFPSKYLSRNFQIKLPTTSTQIEVTIKDKLRGFSSSKSIFSDKSNTTNHQNFRITNLSNNKVVTTQELNVGDTILIENFRSSAPITYYFQKGETKLPPAPFSSNELELPEITNFEKIGTSEEYICNGVKSGVLFFSVDPSANSGVCLFTSTKAFPAVRKMDQLHPPLRYLTTKAEFEAITKSNYPKEKVDQFWLECGGEKERARELIKEYYERVQEANRYFSTYTEGWRTDRGMIHLVFGHPNKITNTGNSEVWIYGDEDSSASLRFTFKKLNSTWSPNIYVLQRDPLFRNYWERMVSAWRSGRVYTY